VGILCSFAALLLPALLASVCDRWVQTGSVDMPRMRHQESLTGVLIRNLALGAFLFYLVWNVAWIASGQIPPSILRAIAGIPCPTTGGYRSLLALCRGEFVQSLLFNPLMLVYLLLFIYSIAVLLRQRINRKRLVLSPLIAWMWCFSLVIGWAAKFALGKQYW
jgi:uncharacterized membrane protein